MINIEIKPEVQLPKKNVDFFIKSLSIFNTYVKDRMDFLADVATSKLSSMEQPVMFYSDLISGINSNTLLMNRISGLDKNVKFQFDINIEGKEKVSISNNNDFPVSMPNDVLGCHAFYIIIENIIRNICKHSSYENLFFKLRIDINSDEFSNYYHLNVYPVFYSKYESINFSNLICNDVGSVIKLSNELNAKINDSILKNNELRDSALGTIEMDICSAYLRKRDLIVVDDDMNKVIKDKFLNEDGTPNFLYTKVEKFEEDKIIQYCLAYSFYLRKPRQVLILDPASVINWKDEEKKVIEKEGIWLLQPKVNSFVYSEQNLYPHELVVIIGDHNVVFNNNVSLRQLKLKSIETDFPNTNEKRTLELYLWRKYFDKKINNIKLNLKNKIQISDKTIFLDDHSVEYEKYINCKDVYYETCTHNQTINRFLNKDLNSDPNYELFLMKYIESIETKLVVIDERIQSNLPEPKKGQECNKFNLFSYFNKQKLYLPSKKLGIDLNSPSFGDIEYCESVAFKIKEYISNHLDAQFIIIHLGVLEKMLKDKNDKSKTRIDELISDLKLNKEQLIITSGRGKPDNLPLDCKFLPLASVQKSLETLKEKFTLVQLAYNARKYK